MKVLFLDIDGVMNCQDTWARKTKFQHFDAMPTALLANILEKTGAQVVISSAWRKTLTIEEFQTLFHAQGLPADRIIGYTPELGRQDPNKRGLEIEQWLDKHAPRSTVFAIVDDDNDMGRLSPRLVLTDYRKGLTRTDAHRLIELLNE